MNCIVHIQLSSYVCTILLCTTYTNTDSFDVVEHIVSICTTVEAKIERIFSYYVANVETISWKRERGDENEKETEREKERDRMRERGKEGREERIGRERARRRGGEGWREGGKKEGGREGWGMESGMYIDCEFQAFNSASPSVISPSVTTTLLLLHSPLESGE